MNRHHVNAKPEAPSLTSTATRFTAARALITYPIFLDHVQPNFCTPDPSALNNRMFLSKASEHPQINKYPTIPKMAAEVAQNPPMSAAESKSARKKREKAAAATAVNGEATPATPVEQPRADSSADGKVDGDSSSSSSYESPYIKELHKYVDAQAPCI